MSRKTLLTEAEVRQFLKLANIGPVGDAKIQEMYTDTLDEDEIEEGGMRPGMRDDDDKPGMRDMREEEDEMEMDLGAADDELGGAEDDLEAADDDLGDMDAEQGAGQMVSVEDFMGALERALEDVLGDEVEVDMDDEEAMDDMEAADDMDAPAEMPDEEEPMMEADHGDEAIDEEAVVNEVARRVAARLQAKQSKENIVEELAEKILQRITSK